MTSAAFSGPTSTRSDNVSIGAFGRHGVVLDHDDTDWLDGVRARLEELIRLPRGWDGYSGQPLPFATAQFAADLLSLIGHEGLPAPSLVPVARGQLQIEWHTENVDIELLVRRPNSVQAYCHRLVGHGAVESVLELTNNFIQILPWIECLQETDFALATAA